MPKEGEVVKAGKAKIGRPTKITPELIKQAWEYIERTSNVSVGELLPTIEGLALAIGVHRSTLQEWEDQNGDFSAIMKELRDSQAQKLIQNALLGRYNPTISKLLLSKHGYVEQQQIDNTHRIVQPILGGSSVKKKEELDDGSSNS